ncbi:MAG: DUF5688 family protein [Lachnospiraceae bacterium]
MKRGKRWKTANNLFRSYLSLLILVDGRAGFEKKELENMVRDVNSSVVSTEDILGNRVYRYDHLKKAII